MWTREETGVDVCVCVGNRCGHVGEGGDRCGRVCVCGEQVWTCGRRRRQVWTYVCVCGGGGVSRGSRVGEWVAVRVGVRIYVHL